LSITNEIIDPTSYGQRLVKQRSLNRIPRSEIEELSKKISLDILPQREKPIIHACDSELPPIELVDTYLGGTPFRDLLLTPVAFQLPMSARFQHHWIVAPPGTGKSTALQFLIARDLELVARNEASIVVMESNRDLIKAIEGLKLFAPGEALEGKLLTIDAEDVEWPVALNLFDVGLDDINSRSGAQPTLMNARRKCAAPSMPASAACRLQSVC